MLQFEHNIKALASRGDLTFAAVKSDIVVCRRVHRWLFILALGYGAVRSLCTYTCSCTAVIAANPHCRVGTYAGHRGRIIQLLSLGDVLLSLGDDKKLLVWAANTYDAPKVVTAHSASQCCAACMHSSQ